MIRLNNVSKRFDDYQALSPLSLDLTPGKTTALLGPSGCGKSTLLRIIVGLIESDTGEIYFGEQLMTRDNIREIRHRMGYMIQDGGLFPHLTIRDNVTLLARHLGWDKPKCEKRLDELADLTHLPEGSVDRFPTQISGGQRQRVALIRALFLDPDVVLLDEPMGALDPLIRAELQEELRSIFQSLNKTVVVVTHDIGEAGFLADEIALLNAGTIAQMGTLADLVRRPEDEFVTTFINAQRSPLESLGEDA
ncbi:MAG: osmoprotectant transport system ATP-binding protein [Pirellulaceae bacterium]|jgi:osmoprotectant transport system ATP-binding protein